MLSYRGDGGPEHSVGVHRVLRVPHSFLGSFMSGASRARSGEGRGRGLLTLATVGDSTSLSPGDEVGVRIKALLLRDY